MYSRNDPGDYIKRNLDRNKSVSLQIWRVLHIPAETKYRWQYARTRERLCSRVSSAGSASSISRVSWAFLLFFARSTAFHKTARLWYAAGACPGSKISVCTTPRLRVQSRRVPSYSLWIFPPRGRRRRDRRLSFPTAHNLNAQMIDGHGIALLPLDGKSKRHL